VIQSERTYASHESLRELKDLYHLTSISHIARPATLLFDIAGSSWGDECESMSAPSTTLGLRPHRGSASRPAHSVRDRPSSSCTAVMVFWDIWAY
jgi:hypothetical protein